MSRNLRFVPALAMLLFCGSALLLTGCPADNVYFADKALESVIRAELKHYFGALKKDELLEITELDASGLNISDLSGLENCKSLIILDLSNNKIESITELTGLTNLTWLDLGSNYIENINPVSGLFFLEYLDLYGENNEIRQWQPLVTNVESGGMGEGAVVTVDTTWTVDSEGNIYPDFQEVYDTLVDAGVTVIFAETDSTQSN